MTGNLSFGDNDKAIFGAGSDLQIYHDGSNSFIDEAGTGNLRIRASSALNLQTRNTADTAWVNSIIADDGAGVRLFTNGSKKLETTSTGVDITGTLTSDGLTVENSTGSKLTLSSTKSGTWSVGEIIGEVAFDGDDSSGIGAGTKGSIQTRSVDTLGAGMEMALRTSDGSNAIRDRFVIAPNGDISFYEDTGTTAKFFWDASAESLGIGTSSPRAKLHVDTASIAANDNFKGLITSYRPNLTFEDVSSSSTDFQLFVDANTFQVRYGDASTDTKLTSEAMRIDSSGNVIHTGGSNGYIQASGTDNAYLRVSGASINEKHLDFYSGTTKQFEVFLDGGQNFIFRKQSGNEERMRIDASGNLLVGKITTSSTVAGIVLGSNDKITATRNGGPCSAFVRTGSDGSVIDIQNDNSTVGSISVSGSSTSFNTSSDYRLKTDAQPMTGASARVQALNPVNFEWIADGTRVDGFLAHEAQAVVPEAVTGTKDAMRDEEYEVTPAVEATYDDEGNELTAAVDAVMGTRSVPDYQGIDQSKLVPLLTAALQEALTKIDNLETRLSALEG
jgi:hypothetical protein